MSEENLEVVRRLFDEWGRGDYSRTDWADPDIEFVSPDLLSGIKRGIDEMASGWREYLSTWDDFEVVGTKFMDVDDKVLVLNEFGGRGKQSGVPIEGMRGATLFTFENGRVVRLAVFGNEQKAFDAAGLSE